MDIEVKLLDGQKLEALFDGFSVLSDQPLSNKGNNEAPSPYDYFLASTALCAGYFTKQYCLARNISLEGIKIVQKNIRDHENKYKQFVTISVTVPKNFPEKDRQGIIRSIEGCSVKKTIMEIPEFKIEVND